MNATVEQIVKVEKLIAMGTKLTFEQVLAIVIKKELKDAPKQQTKKSAAKQQQRENVRNSTFKCDDLGEYNRANALKNLPSNLR